MASRRYGMQRTITVLAGACLLVIPASMSGVAMAQTSPPSTGRGNYFTVKPPGSVDYLITDKPVIIAAQVQYALKRETTARQMLAGYADFESLTPITDVIHDGYVLLRTAQHGLERAQSNAKYPNPLLATRAQKIRDARDHLLSCMNAMGNAQKWQDARYVAEASDSLDMAIEVIEALIPLML